MVESNDNRKSRLRAEINRGLLALKEALHRFGVDVEESKDSPAVYNLQYNFRVLYEFAIDGDVSQLERFGYDELYDAWTFYNITDRALEHVEFSRLDECRLVLIAASARVKLEGDAIDTAINEIGCGDILPGYRDDLLTLFEVSVLANMSEKSVRNATHKTKTDRLVTTKVGGSTYVTPEEAKLWLKDRRGFVPTDFSPNE